MAIIKTNKITNVGEDVEKLEPLHITSGNVQSLWKILGGGPEKIKQLSYDLTVLLRDIPKRIKNRYSNKYLYTNVH